MNVPEFDREVLETRGVHVRPLERTDTASLSALLEQSAKVSGSDEPSYEGVAQILDRFGARLVTDSLVVLSEAEEPIAVALVFLPPASGDDEGASLLGVVRPDHYEQGLGTAVLSWMERRVCMAREANDSLLSIRMSCDPTNLARLRLFEQHGFKPVRYSFKMQTPLVSPFVEPSIPSELALVPWQGTWSESARSAFNRAFKGHWGLPTISEEMWKSRFVEVPQFRPALSWLVVHESEVVGLSVNWLPPDASQGWIEAIGVVPEWRGRGVEDAMMARSLNTFLEHGLTKAALDVDTQNPTGALQLYEKVGFTAAKREAIFVKALG
jgi:ribosomal protein S18 acetylase RimI-like enzyme